MTLCYRSAMVACSVSVLASVGCTSTRDGIPTGEWSGQGIYVDYEAMAKEKLTDVAQSLAKDNVYETSLKISQQRMYGRDTLFFDIRSKRGKLLNMDDEESHVEFALVPLKTLKHGARLYAVGHREYNPSADCRPSEEEFNQRLRIASASCIQQGGATVLQVYYMIPTKNDPSCFFDTFVFEGSRVRKTGHVVNVSTTEKENKPVEQKLAKVYWVETLRKTR